MDSRRHLPMARWRCRRSALRSGEWPAVSQDVVWRLSPGAWDALAAWAELRAAASTAPPAGEAEEGPTPAPAGDPGGGGAETATPTGGSAEAAVDTPVPMESDDEVE
eukprot:6897241-Alexandrium_andersonii.AAC.1